MAATNTQFSVGVHIMTALGYYSGQEVISSALSESLNADPSLVRRVLSKLAKAGLVKTSRGRGGHCSLAKPPNKISLLEIYKACETPPLFAIHTYPIEKGCPISCSHKESMTDLLQETQTAFEAKLKKKMLSDFVRKLEKK